MVLVPCTPYNFHTLIPRSLICTCTLYCSTHLELHVVIANLIAQSWCDHAITSHGYSIVKQSLSFWSSFRTNLFLIFIFAGGKYRTRSESCVFSLEQFWRKKRFMLCCVLLFFSVINPSCASTILQYWQLRKYNLVCHAMILSSTIHQYIDSHLRCSQRTAPIRWLSPSLLSDNCGAVVCCIVWFCEFTMQHVPWRWDADYLSFKNLSQSPARGSQCSS